jgi:hypothetical protein
MALEPSHNMTTESPALAAQHVEPRIMTIATVVPAEEGWPSDLRDVTTRVMRYTFEDLMGQLASLSLILSCNILKL